MCRTPIRCTVLGAVSTPVLRAVARWPCPPASAYAFFYAPRVRGFSYLLHVRHTRPEGLVSKGCLPLPIRSAKRYHRSLVVLWHTSYGPRTLICPVGILLIMHFAAKLQKLLRREPIAASHSTRTHIKGRGFHQGNERRCSKSYCFLFISLEDTLEPHPHIAPNVYQNCQTCFLHFQS